MAGMLSDISVRKQTEEALKSSELRLKHAHEMALLGSWMYEPATGALQWSNELYRIFEMEGTPDKDLYATYRSKIHPEDIPMLNAAIATGKAYQVEFRVRCKNDQIKYVLGVGDFIRDSKKNVLKMVGIGQDITERKLLENNRLEYQQTLEVLLFTLSHKIRKPVANIQAIAEVMDSDELQTSPVLKEFLGYLNQSNRELDAYIHELNHLLAEKKRNLI
jgi:signal transduction histidine kinase